MVAATHALLSDPATERLKNGPISEIVITNTLPLPPEKQLDKITTLSIAPLLARAIRESSTTARSPRSSVAFPRFRPVFPGEKNPPPFVADGVNW